MDKEMQKWQEQQCRRIIRKYWNQGMPIFVRQHRTLNTALKIVARLSDIAFVDVSLNLYFLCSDGSDYSDFCHKYESMIELAKSNKDTFVQQLHHFYTQTALYIEKNCYYQMFFDFLSYFINRQHDDMSSIPFEVYSSYMDILLQQVEYLRPDKMNFNQLVVGIKSNGSGLLTAPDPMPNLDIPHYLA